MAAAGSMGSRLAVQCSRRRNSSRSHGSTWRAAPTAFRGYAKAEDRDSSYEHTLLTYSRRTNIAAVSVSLSHCCHPSMCVAMRRLSSMLGWPRSGKRSFVHPPEGRHARMHVPLSALSCVGKGGPFANNARLVHVGNVVHVSHKTRWKAAWMDFVTLHVGREPLNNCGTNRSEVCNV
eukprot:157849-Chlamydomonas_euryale.AAC.3